MIDLRSDHYCSTEQRVQVTTDFLDMLELPILDIGQPNGHCEDLKKRYNIDITNTQGNLDLNEWSPLNPKHARYKTIFCFEVIEHLMSPRFFLERLKKFMDKDAVLYISYPRRIEFFWTKYHFHEYSTKRFLHLIDDAGYEVIKHKWIWERGKGFNIGIRPLFRLTPIGRARRHFYKLRLK